MTYVCCEPTFVDAKTLAQHRSLFALPSNQPVFSAAVRDGPAMSTSLRGIAQCVLRRVSSSSVVATKSFRSRTYVSKSWRVQDDSKAKGGAGKEAEEGATQQQPRGRERGDRDREADREVDREVTKLFAQTLRLLVKQQQSAAGPANTGTGNSNSNSNTPLSSLNLDPEALKRVQAAENRIRQRLIEIANANEHQLQRLVHKYAGFNQRVALAAQQGALWNPDAPFLLKSFLESLDKEYGAQSSDSLPAREAEIQAALEEQEALRLSVDELLETDDDGRDCILCGPDRHLYPLEPMNVPFLARFLNTAGKILPRSSSGLCKKHQSRMARVIKWARGMNLFTYKNSSFSINNPFKPADTLFQPAVLTRYGIQLPGTADMTQQQSK